MRDDHLNFFAVATDVPFWWCAEKGLLILKPGTRIYDVYCNGDNLCVLIFLLDFTSALFLSRSESKTADSNV